MLRYTFNLALRVCALEAPAWHVAHSATMCRPPSWHGCLAQDDAAAAHWFPVEEPPSLAFDHKLIIREAFETLTQRAEVKDNGETCW